MKNILFIAGLLFILGGCSTEKTNFGQLQDRNGLLYLANTDKPFTGDVVSYANGHVEFEGRIENGMRVGTWVYFHPNGQKKTSGNYKEGVKDGVWNAWKENGEQDVAENYKFGKKLNSDGTFAEPAKDTTAAKPAEKPVAEKPVKKEPQPIQYERLHGGGVKYLDGVPYSGPVIKYYKGDGKEFEGWYLHGKKNGRWTFYDKKGRVKNIKDY